MVGAASARADTRGVSGRLLTAAEAMVAGTARLDRSSLNSTRRRPRRRRCFRRHCRAGSLVGGGVERVEAAYCLWGGAAFGLAKA